MREKRRFKRLDVRLPVTLRCEGRLIPATTLNISCGGVCLDVEGAQPEWFSDSKVELVIDLSQEARDISLRGEVTRIESAEHPKIGVKFTNLYTVGHQSLEEFVNRNLN